MDTRPTLVVGIGASAGGIPAIQELLANVPAGHGMSFVVVMHLSSDHPSHLATVLASKTDLRVEQISDGDKIRPDTVHVIPPGQILEIQDSVLHLRPEERSHRESRPIDVFFASLAEDQGEDAVGILLSGANSDGTLGIKQIKETGGITIAQSGNGPDFAPKMPESAIAVGLIDFAEEPSDIPARLLHIQDGNNQLQSLERSDLAKKESDRARQIQHDIAKLLKRQTGHPFSGYKQKTFLRRVMRRMKIHKDRTPEDYLERLRADPEEGMDLFRDLLINVTGFFRDPDAFEALRTEVIPRLFKGRLADATIRIWVPGCATGEEVFSLGILFTEYSDTLEDPPAVQIFATDIDEQALSVARAGRYPKQALDGLSQERIERFFENDAMEFTIAKRVRDMWVFSAHSIISHPPFSRMDLVSCRNLLIYLGQELQEKVIPTFHYAACFWAHPRVSAVIAISSSPSTKGSDCSKHARRSRGFVPRREPSTCRVPIFPSRRPSPVPRTTVDAFCATRWNSRFSNGTRRRMSPSRQRPRSCISRPAPAPTSSFREARPAASFSTWRGAICASTCAPFCGT